MPVKVKSKPIYQREKNVSYSQGGPYKEDTFSSVKLGNTLSSRTNKQRSPQDPTYNKKETTRTIKNPITGNVRTTTKTKTYGDRTALDFPKNQTSKEVSVKGKNKEVTMKKERVGALGGSSKTTTSYNRTKKIKL